MATLARRDAYRQRIRRDGADDTPLLAAPRRALVWLASAVAHPYGRTPRSAVDPGLLPGAPAAVNPRAPRLAIQPRGQTAAHHSQAQQIPEVSSQPGKQLHHSRDTVSVYKLYTNHEEDRWHF